MAVENTKTKIAGVFEALKGTFSYDNVMQAPKIEKVIVSTGTGKIDDKQKIALIQDRLARITGQKASPRPAKKSIASFKLATKRCRPRISSAVLPVCIFSS